ncbi:MAG: B12-binding domain-containing radical SAM protein [Thermodesulfobacteriota bacterium]
MNVLLTNPGSRNVFRTFGFVFPPTGLLYVAAYAEKMGCDVTVKDFCISNDNPKNFSFKDYDIVGITSDTRQAPGAMDIAGEAKKAGCTVVIGGTHAQFVAEELLGNGSVDFVVHGEGELTFHELVTTIDNNNDLSKVRGISYKGNGIVRKTDPRELISDLDTLPFPARHLVDMDAYTRTGFKYGNKRPVIMISTSRGCPHNCYFCAVPSISGRGWRYRSVDSIMAELEYLYDRCGYRAVGFSDDNFTISTKRVKELCNRIIEKGYDLWWWSMSSPDILIKNEDMVELMARAGAKSIFIGVESASEETLKEFNKKMDGNTAEKATAILKRHRIEVYASYIIGGLHDSVGSILKTIRFARRLDTNIAQFTILTPYPGTALYEEVKDKIFDKRWHRYDGFRLVFRHRNVSYYKIQFLLLWAYISFYLRSSRALKGFVKAFAKNNSVMKKILRRRFDQEPAKGFSP